MRIPSSIRVALTTVLATLAIAFGTTPRPQAQDGQVPEAWLLPPRDGGEMLRCATGEDRVRELRVRPLAAVPDGRVGSFVQDPPILSADFDGRLVLRDFVVLGDVPTARFVPWVDSSIEVPEPEVWTRSETRRIGGRLVSVFTPSWSGVGISKFMRSNRWGWDDGGIYWGEFLPGDAAEGTGSDITLRIAPSTLPRVAVARLSADVQYSSHVVNIMMPTFGDSFFQDDHGFELQAVSQRFYQDFQDSYDTLAIVPEANYNAPYSAFHRNVRNEVRGIGLTLMDNSSSYGSANRRLQGVELYVGADFTRASSTSHELAHQWGSYLDWARLASIRRAGHQPEAHDPLWSVGETLIGSVLRASRRVEPATDGWRIRLTPSPARLHPFTLYAMGLLPKEAVPTVTVFDDQAQFSPTFVSTPGLGTLLAGGERTVTVFNVIGMNGERSGPVPSVLQRATIVVSRDHLLTAREMDYWTYFAARMEDPAGTGVPSVEGVGSFEAATSGLVDVRSDVRPLRAAPLGDLFDVDGRSFGTNDVRGVVFDSAINSQYRVGQNYVWSGLVKATDRSDLDQILIRLWKYGGTSSDAILMWARVDARSTFRLERGFDESQRGVYEMEVFLFWPGSGPQYSRADLSPIIIE